MTSIIKKLLIVTVLLTACTPIDTGKPYTTNLKHDRVILFWKTHDDVHDVCGALSQIGTRPCNAACRAMRRAGVLFVRARGPEVTKEIGSLRQLARDRSGPLGTARDRSGPLGTRGIGRDRSGSHRVARIRYWSIRQHDATTQCFPKSNSVSTSLSNSYSSHYFPPAD